MLLMLPKIIRFLSFVQKYTEIVKIKSENIYYSYTIYRCMIRKVYLILIFKFSIISIDDNVSSGTATAPSS